MVNTAFSGRGIVGIATLAALTALTAAGCGGGGGTSSGTESGQLTVLMADAPPDLGNVTEVNVTISRVEVLTSGAGATTQQVTPPSGSDTVPTDTDSGGAAPNTATGSGGWKTVFQGSQTFNLLELANVEDVTTLPHLVDSSLTAGQYNQLRLIVDSGSITVDGQTYPLTIPSGANTGLKSLPFTVYSKQNTVLLLDFDVAQSVRKTGDGQYVLTPVIRLAPVKSTTSATGTVVDEAGAPVSAQVTLKNGAGAVVATSITSLGNAQAARDGVFALHGLPTGTYSLEVAASGYTTRTESVTVTVPTVVEVGSVALTPAAGS